MPKIFMERKFIKKFVILVLLNSLLPVFLHALIIQTNKIDEVLKHIHSDTWVFFDIDDTLLTSKVQLGHPEYYLLKYLELKKQGYDDESAQEICGLHWHKIQDKYPVRFLEAETFEVVRQTQQIVAHTIGLTARGPQTNHVTHKQLKSLGVDFSISSPKEIIVDLPIRNLYEQGIWFVEANGKGSSVRKWLTGLENHPTKIVFIDDLSHNLQGMEQELSDLEIEYVGIHYCRAQETPFNAEIALIQAASFPHILTDEEALEQLQNLP